MEGTEELKEVSHEVGCKDCGAILKFAPGTTQLKCDYCGSMNDIAPKNEASAAAAIAEQDFESFLASEAAGTEKQEIYTVKCTGCGATSTLKPNVVSDNCAFCGTSLVIQNAATEKVIKPRSILPFKVDQKSAFGHFTNWIKKLWFAPNDLKKFADNFEKLKGMYIPYWTYDCKTYSQYTGERGIDQYHTESYSATVNGRSEMRTRQVKVVHWYPVSGSTNWSFDDVLVNASNSLPKDYTEKLEPWDLPNLLPFDEKFLSGFQAETYQLGLEEGFEVAKGKMQTALEERVRRDIGGDHQRIHSIDTQYSDITFKHTLLPVWISAYRYKGKIYRFLINGRTGEVQGERPYSIPKIVFAVIGGITAVIVIYNLMQGL